MVNWKESIVCSCGKMQWANVSCEDFDDSNAIRIHNCEDCGTELSEEKGTWNYVDYSKLETKTLVAAE